MAERTISIRELNQNAGRAIQSVAEHGAVQITDHGQVVAMLVPVPDSMGAWERWVQSGQVTEATSEPLQLPTPREHPRSSEEMVDVTRQILDEASAIPHHTRTLGAIHLATARHLTDSDVEMLTYDRGMARAAPLVGVPLHESA